MISMSGPEGHPPERGSVTEDEVAVGEVRSLIASLAERTDILRCYLDDLEAVLDQYRRVRDA